MSFRDKEKTALREVIEAQGEDGATRIITEALKTKKLRAEDFSIREIWDACTGGADVSEAVASSSFPKITGALINSKVIEGYESAARIGDLLCQTVPSNVQKETIVGFTGTEVPMEVGEGQEYSDSTFTEKYVTADNVKYGRLLSVTEETIKFDKIGQILQRARMIGEGTAQWRERLIMRGIQDLDTTVYKPSGVATALYSTANGNLSASTPFGEAGMEAVLKLIQMQKGDSIGTTDDDFIGITITNPYVLVPADLEVESFQLSRSTLTPESAENAENFFKGRFTSLSSSYITQASSSTWFYGDFKRDFWWLEVWPLQTFSQAAGSEDDYKRDIKASFKTRMYGTIAAVDFKHVYKATA